MLWQKIRNVKLSEHFTLDEMCMSQTAVRNGIDNTPGTAEMKNLKALCVNILEPFRGMVGPLRVSSGFRCVKVNKLTGGVPTSQHCKGQAADLVPISTPLKKAYLSLVDSDLEFDQAIYEFGNWVHVSFSNSPRRQCLVAYKSGGKTKYDSLENFGRGKL